jgi:hypothetical protein
MASARVRAAVLVSAVGGTIMDVSAVNGTVWHRHQISLALVVGDHDRGPT